MTLISVIICTYNPNLDYLTETLESLKGQTLQCNKWELLIIDNASTIPISTLVDIKWHPNGRHLIENNVGLTPARIRGIKEAKSDFLLFVDDDNCLKENYLKICLNILQSTPLLGVVGAGKILPKFEKEPIGEENEFLRSLAIRDEFRAYYSNEIRYHKALPFGAGLCIRKSLALAYVESCETRPPAATLDRRGKALLSGGDIDMALHACRDGYLAGVLPELELIHIIPKARLDHDYLVKIAAGHAASSYILSQLWKLEEYPENQLVRLGRYWKKRFKSKGLSKKILIAEYEGEREARRQWRAFNS